MPPPGDQHKAWTNPYEETKPRVSGWTAKEIAIISSRLDKQLGPEYISSRAGPGGNRVHYLTAEKCISLANEVFGFNGWSTSIQNIQVDFADENPQNQRVSIGLSVIVRVTLRDGTYHEDIGYGSIENAKGKAMAFEKAKKEGTTDALKRTLRNFGNVLGNCIYDKDFVNQVTKIKAQPIKKFDQDNLHRHTDFVKKELAKVESTSHNAGNGDKGTLVPVVAPTGVKTEPIDSYDDFLGELDEADFCVPGDGHPDEIILPNSVQAPNDKSAVNDGWQMQQPAGQSGKSMTGNNAGRQPHTPRPAQPPRPVAQGDGPAGPPSRPQCAAQLRQPQNQDIAPHPSPPSGPVAFLSARATLPDLNQPGNKQAALPQHKPLFNPKAESPSIRKTPGIDHTSSRPVGKDGQHVTVAKSQPAAAPDANTSSFTPVRNSFSSSQAGRGSVVNLSLDQARRIGAPGGMGSPLANRGQYKPPTMKRTLPNEENGTNGSRSPLVEIPTNANNHVNAGARDGLEAKRQKMA